MTKAFIATILLAAAIGSTSCRKGPYTCYCTSNDNTRSDQTYGLATDDESQAQYECDKYQTSLGNGGGSFNCFLERSR
jgi:hypothetical protein